MPTAMTYDSLLTDLRAYIERGNSADTTVYDQLPKLIGLTEREIAHTLKIQGLITVVTNTMGIGQSVYAKPDRWRETVSINFGVGATQVRTPIFPRSYEYCRMYWPDEDLTSQPKFYADYNYENWLFAPTPDAAYPFEVSYYGLPPLLDSSNQTNWLTEYAPNALLHGSLMKAAELLRDEKMISVWQQEFTKDLGLLNGEDLQKIIDRSVSRQEA